MNKLPTVALLVGPEMYRKMFRIEDLDRLHSASAVIGPLPSNATIDDYRELMKDATVVITGWGTQRLTDPLLNDAPALKLVAHSAGSIKGVVDDSTYNHGIRVTTAASANAEPVAEFTVAMMVSLLKQIPWIGLAHARGDHEEVRRRRPHLRELMDMEIGIIGASRVGRRVIGLLARYPRLTIKCYDPYLTDEQASALGVRLVPLHEACRCEIVSIHAPNIPETQKMFNAERLSLLPDHGVLINTARGALVDEEALSLELRRRPIYTCLDVTDPEPPAADSPLRDAPNLLLTPHIAGALQQACREMGALAISQVLAFLNNAPLQHEVTQEMLPTQA